MKRFQVTFKWYDTDTYCTNICEAESEEIVREYYEKKYNKVLSISSITDAEFESQKRKRMPIKKFDSEVTL